MSLAVYHTVLTICIHYKFPNYQKPKVLSGLQIFSHYESKYLIKVGSYCNILLSFLLGKKQEQFKRCIICM